MNAATLALNPGLDLGTPAPALRGLLEEHEAATRTNRSNDGRGFQKEIEVTIGGYQSRRTATIRKVDPPTRVVGGRGEARRVIFMSNPWLDFAGSWTRRHGRAIFVEAKSTATHRLPFKRSGGITEEQLATIKTWRHAGAATCVVWQWAGRVVLYTPEMLVAAEARGDKSLVFEQGLAVPRGDGSVLWDFLAVLERVLWP